MKIRFALDHVDAGRGARGYGVCIPKAHNLPPAQQLLEPGPGVGGPGPGVLPPSLPPAMIPVSMPSVQVLFARPEGMQVRWDVGGVEPVRLASRSSCRAGRTSRRAASTG